MKRSNGLRAVGGVVLVAAIAGCTPSDTGDVAAGADPRYEGGAATAASPTRVALPGLFSIMAGLQDDMAGLERGLWREDFDSIAARATAIADHPMVPPAEAQAIAGVLGPDMAAFKQHDTRVHDWAVRIRELAIAEDFEGVVATRADLVDGCVGCHTEFRERIRAGLR